MTDTKIKEYIYNNLSKARYEHSVSVAETASDIGARLGLTSSEVNDLYTAGLLHDIAKELPKDEQAEIIKRHGTLSEDDVRCPSTMHQLAGAYLARELFGVSDAIFGMIRYHCTGSPDMTLCEKIIFISDYIEPTRKHKSCVLLNRYFYERELDLRLIDLTAVKCCRRTLDLLVAKGYPVHPLTLKAYEKLKEVY